MNQWINASDYFVGGGGDFAGNLAGGDFLLALFADNGDLIGDSNLYSGDVDNYYVHGNSAENFCPLAPNEHLPYPRQGPGQSVPVANWNNGDRGFAIDSFGEVVAYELVGRDGFDFADDAVPA